MSIVTGALSGAVATGPMTGIMLGAHRLLPIWHKGPVPPKKLAMAVASRIGLKQHLSKQEKETASWISHFGYGAVMGGLYGPVSRQIPAPPLVKGIVFGLLVWAGSYLGFIPLADLPDAATDQPWERNAMMIAAHIVWGAVLGLTAAMLPPRAQGQSTES